MTLNLLIYDILLEARNSLLTESEKLSTRLIQMWIQTYRSMLIKLKLGKGEPLEESFYLEKRMHLSKVEDAPGHFEYVSDEELPALISKNFGDLVVKDAYGNLILLGTETKMKFQGYRKFTCKDYIAYLKHNKVYVEGLNNQIEYVDVKYVAEDPSEEKACYDPDKDEYPLPGYMWATIKQLIITRDFLTMRQQVSDLTNNTVDDTQNSYNPNVNRSIRR